MDVDGSNLTRITKTANSEGGAVWIDGGKRIAFTYPVDGVPQVWVMDADARLFHRLKKAWQDSFSRLTRNMSS